jgi:hypothetical protein
LEDKGGGALSYGSASCFEGEKRESPGAFAADDGAKLLAQVFSVKESSIACEAIGEGKTVFAIKGEFKLGGPKKDGILRGWPVGVGGIVVLCEEARTE